MLSDGLDEVCKRKRGTKEKLKFLVCASDGVPLNGVPFVESGITMGGADLGIGAENQQFIFEHTKFKMPNEFPLEMSRRQLDMGL